MSEGDDDLARAIAAARQQIDLVKGDDRLQGLREKYQSLSEFMRGAWHVLEPRRPLVWGWHIDCILTHLEAVHRGEIQYLLINIPPAHIKTTLANIVFPAWRWAGGEMPEARTLAGSYSMPMAKKSAEKSRNIVMSKWYQEIWPEIALKRAVNSVPRFENTLGGGRYCFSTGGPLPGDHCDTAIWDDPLKASDAMSPRQREKAIEYLEESIPSRLIDQLTGAIIIIMQRLHEKDPAGHVLLAEYPDLVHVCIPAHFDPDRACVTRWFRDPGSEKGGAGDPAADGANDRAGGECPA